MNYLDEEQQKIAKDCVYNIQDKINAIAMELNKERAYKSYMLEKLNCIEWDFTCLKSMCDTEGEE